MVMKRQGKSWSLKVGSTARALLPNPCHNSGMAGHFTMSITTRPKAMKSKAMAKMGYILPMSLSMGSRVAMI